MKKILLAILLVWIPLTTFAVKVSSLYRADVLVLSQSDDEKEKAARIGLTQILIKLTGDAEIESDPKTQLALKNALSYVQEFSYSSSGENQYTIHILYDKTSLKNLLKKSDKAYWGENRPLTLIWLDVTNPHQATEVIGSESPSHVLNRIKQQGKKYGLPVIFPIMDMADLVEVSTEDIKSMNTDLLKQASKRYRASVILIGKIENEMQSQWQLIFENKQWDWMITGKSIDEMTNAALYKTSQIFAKNFAVKTKDAANNWLTIEVAQVNDNENLQLLLHYLKQLTSVQQVNLSQITGDAVQLSILIHGSLTSFQQNALIGQHLLLKAEEPEQNKLIYEWVR